ncbi:ComEA family DNA-binding protein [Streptacidiphilus anmyonensis]|uniref:ComEA family DNA-binding protein n=1 Tax=Streptacidiphilus anmyonensis TaxID=405782 RepID=UPI0009FBE5DC|nr:ComEA family DNA-binding protein [Streptacidiphilus anmyonensis]
MRTAFTPAARARREATTALVRHRVDTLFGPRAPFPVASAAAPSPPPPPASAPPGSVPPAPVPPVPAPVAVALAVPVPAAGVTAVLPQAAPDPRRQRPPLASSLSSLTLALKERWDLDRRALVGLAVLLVLALGYGVQHFWAGRPEPVAVPAPAVEGTAAVAAASPSSGSASGTTSGTTSGEPSGSSGGPAPSSTAIAQLVVDVSGKVRNPGLRTLPPGSRVQDALNAAGGPLPGTDLTGLNLARKVGDGEEIIVGGPAPGPGGAARAAGPLSLSSATEAQLDALPGIGPVLAQRIIAFREQHGGFQSVDQLRLVPGFGDRRLQDLRAQLRP